MSLFERRRRVQAHRPNKASFKPFFGMILMAASFFLYATSGTVAPWWAVLALMLLWVFLLSLCVVWWTPFPDRLPVVGAISVVVYFVAMFGGAFLLGWSA